MMNDDTNEEEDVAYDLFDDTVDIRRKILATIMCIILFSFIIVGLAISLVYNGKVKLAERDSKIIDEQKLLVEQYNKGDLAPLNGAFKLYDKGKVEKLSVTGDKYTVFITDKSSSDGYVNSLDDSFKVDKITKVSDDYNKNVYKIEGMLE